MRKVAHLIIHDSENMIMHIRGQDHTLGFPGGIVEPHESIVEGLLREVDEEYHFIPNPSLIKLATVIVDNQTKYYLFHLQVDDVKSMLSIFKPDNREVCKIDILPFNMEIFKYNLHSIAKRQLQKIFAN